VYFGVKLKLETLENVSGCELATIFIKSDMIFIVHFAIRSHLLTLHYVGNTFDVVVINLY